MTECHVEQVSHQCIMVTPSKNYAEKYTKNQPQLLEAESLLDNAPLHVGYIETKKMR